MAKGVNKTIGNIYILVGSVIGAGMLALPLVAAGSGFVYSVLLLIFNWLLMTLTALLTLEATSAFELHHNSFNTMTKKLLGKSWQIITLISYLMLLYATIAAYIDGGASLLDVILGTMMYIKIPFWTEALIFTLIFGGIVFFGAHAIDHSMRFLLSVKIILLAFALVLLLPYVDVSNLFSQTFYPKYLLSAAPIFLNAFGFHFVISSVYNYCNRPARVVQWIIITSTTIPLIIYIFWLAVTFGMIPIVGASSFTSIAHKNTSVGGLIQILTHIANNKLVTVGINIFFNIAMTTSFLGVALGLFDFLADIFRRSDTLTGRLQTSILTFLPPFLFVLFYKNGFIVALEYSAFFAIILEVFLPAFLVYKLRHSSHPNLFYRVPINTNFLLFALGGIGLILLVIVILNKLNVFAIL